MNDESKILIKVQTSFRICLLPRRCLELGNGNQSFSKSCGFYTLRCIGNDLEIVLKIQIF